MSTFFVVLTQQPDAAVDNRDVTINEARALAPRS